MFYLAALRRVSSDHTVCLLLTDLSFLPLPSLMEEVSKQGGGHLGILRQQDGKNIKHSQGSLMFSCLRALDAAMNANK